MKSLFNTIDNTHIAHDLDDLKQYDKIIVDAREIDDDLYSSIKGRNIIAIDEGGPYRDEIPYLIDILPLPSKFSAPNIRSVSFLDLPEKGEYSKNNKILVSFGGEDPAHLTELLTKFISQTSDHFISKCHIVLGPLYKGKLPDSRFHIIQSPRTLKDIIPRYSGVICSFGLTAYETNHLDIPVLLINPEEYHEELSRISGFTSSGVRTIDSDLMNSFIDNPKIIEPIASATEDISLGDFINGLDAPEANCPVCSSREYHVVSRHKFRTYCRCNSCEMLFMVDFSKNKMSYGKEYFFKQYENQYGKTYLDDFDHLTQLADQRLKNINRKTTKASTLLDVGCAYGPFLKQASLSGFQSYGTDISDDAVKHVRDELDFEAITSEFDNFSIPETWNLNHFDVLTMWYVIEHFNDLSIILNKVNSLLKIGGVFSFSTPSGSGISSKTDLNKFLDHSPADHFTIWEPEKSRKILNMFGFEIYKIRNTGHHPERFASNLRKNYLGSKLLHMKSKILNLGDTFEIYAQKVREI